LENVTIPRIEFILDDIGRELDELEREDFTRIKVLQKAKEEELKAEELENKKKKAKEKKENNTKDIMSEFDAADDEDIVF